MTTLKCKAGHLIGGKYYGGIVEVLENGKKLYNIYTGYMRTTKKDAIADAKLEAEYIISQSSGIEISIKETTT